MDESGKYLVFRIGRGEQLAMRSLFTRYQLRVYRFVLRLVKHEGVAEELTNEVFMDVWRNAKKFEGRSAVSTWLLAIARNRSYSYLRKRRDEVMDDKFAERIHDGSDNPETATQKNDKGMIMRQCMMKLSPEHSEIIDLVYYHEKSISEVSEIIAVPVNTVKTRMFYARKKFGVLLREAGLDRGWP